MFVRLPFANGALDLAHCRRPEWTLARAATFTSELDVGLSVPICWREMEIGDREPRRFISARPSVVKELQHGVVAATLGSKLSLLCHCQHGIQLGFVEVMNDSPG